jgi:hypothetical protein
MTILHRECLPAELAKPVNQEAAGVTALALKQQQFEDDLAAPGGSALVGHQADGLGTAIRTAAQKLSETRSFADFGAVSGELASPAANDVAIAAAIAWAKANFPSKLVATENYYLFSAPWPVIDKPINIEGLGNNQTYFQCTAAMVGQAVTVRNVGFGEETTLYPITGNRAFTSLSNAIAGLRMKGFTLLGDRSSAGIQDGLVFEGNCDFFDIDVETMYFNGRGLWTGKEAGGRRGNMREGRLSLRTRCCGNADGTASVTFEVVDSPTNPIEDTSNLIKEINIDCVFPYGRGVEFADRRTINAGPPLYGMTGKLMLHGPSSGYFQNGALLHIEGDIQLLDLDVNIAYSRSPTEDIVVLANAATGKIPSQNKIKMRQPNSIQGAYVENARNLVLDYQFAFTRQHVLRLGTGLTGPIDVSIPGDGVFQQITSSKTLNGTNPVALAGWLFNTTANLSTFFPVVNTNGTGDTLKAAIFGIVGTITRSGSVVDASDTYTFTPDASSTAFIPAQEYFSKFLVPASQTGVVSGRYVYNPTTRQGPAVSGSWLSKRLLNIKPWTVWFESTGLLRQIFGQPTSDNSGFPYAPWRKMFIGATPTPNVAGFSYVYANYASATTVTNFTGGVDGQLITVVANNSNCTIQNNATIKTISGSDVVLATGKSAQFIFSADLEYWVQT